MSASVKVTVNGKIDAVKLHLDEQDKIMQDLIKKIAPLDGAKKWFSEFFQGIIYFGLVAGAIAAIVAFLKVLKVL